VNFDVIIIGAGAAGNAAAITLAKGGAKVLQIERGKFPGEKNLMGGIIYSSSLEEIVPDFWKNAPIERPITEQNYWVSDKQSVTKLGYSDDAFKAKTEAPAHAYTVLRSEFDKWMAGEAKKHGAMLLPATVVLDLIVEDGKVVGVVTDRPNGEIRAPLVISGEGVNAFVSWKRNFGSKPKPDEVALVVKEVIELPEDVIEDRFQISGNEGASYEIFGDITKGCLGYAFLYTNRKTVSIGVGSLVADFANNEIASYELLEHVKNHKSIKPFLKGGKTIEYAGHLIPEGGYKKLPTLVADGFLMTGDAALMVNAVHREGSNFAFVSGRLAGEVALEAIKNKDFSSGFLNAYRKKLEDSFILKDLKSYEDVFPFFRKRRDILNDYPQLISYAAKSLLTVDGTPKGKKKKNMVKGVLKMKNPAQIVKDLYNLLKVLGK
tara:strand:+ start:1747 stop:3048 length:1302 start_codon:yes stop_codon:yes gene_type:complete